MPLCLAMAPLAIAFAQPVAVAWSSGRPAECAIESAVAPNIWERAKSPDLRRYCDLVASAASKLAGTAAMAQKALLAAREADAVLPGHGAPRVLEGRALAALGKFDEAFAALREGKARNPAALDEPSALHAWARLLGRMGHLSDAVEAYRALLPRTAPLSTSERAASDVEAGLVAMASGPDGIDDAVAAFREALHQVSDDVFSVAVPALALALDRRGDPIEARAILAGRAGQLRGDPRVALEGPRAVDLLAVAPKEALAIEGLALESEDAAGAHDAWTQYLAAAAPGPWDAHTRAHLAALVAGSSRRGRK